METKGLREEEKKQEQSGDESAVPETKNPDPLNPVDPLVTPESKVQIDGLDENEKHKIESPDKANLIAATSEKDENMLDTIGSKPPVNGSDMEVEYEMVDALEVATQVANKVEPEVDSREKSCSTSEKTSGGELERPKSQESQPVMAPVKELSPGPETETETETIGSDHRRDAPTSQVSEVAQVSEKGVDLGFDLNEEVCSEETDLPLDSVSASPAIVPSASPIAPLQFEGTHGWKGSAATSAFRQILDGTHNNSKQSLNIDLNMTDDSGDKNPIISGEESSIELGPVKLHLDLNSLGDGSVDTVSSSSSSMQPSMKNIDLNLIEQNNSSLDHRNYGKLFNVATAYLGVPNRDENVISLFGTPLGVKRQDAVPNRAAWGLGSSMAVYGHNGMYFPLPYGPPGAPNPYMVDPRGVPVQVPVAPHFMGSSSALQPALFQQAPPFVMNMAEAGRAGLSQRNFDLNDNRGSSSSSGVGEKRKEPDGGWEGFPVNYKHR